MINNIVRKPFRDLRAEMTRNDVDNAYLAEHFGRSKAYVGSRLTGKISWTVDEAFAICDLLRIPYAEMPRYFQREQIDIEDHTNRRGKKLSMPQS